MSAKNPEYDFKWCPGCGDFGVRRALEFAMQDYSAYHEQPMANTVVIAGIGCSGNLVHLLEGEQPYGFHGIHGRTLPIAFGAKMARPDLNVLVVAGDGDFLSIGMEHIAPQAARNLDVCCVIMDNGVYGLTKGQSSPTTDLGVITSSTPYGKMEGDLNPLDYYLSIGVSFIASGYSSKPKDLGKLIQAGMEHKGFSIVHVMSPCTTYNDNYEQLKGNAKKGVESIIFDVPKGHNASDREAAHKLINSGKIPIGVVYQNEARLTLDKRLGDLQGRVKPKSVQEQLGVFEF
ncbi:MAG: 2-oxoacid:ferredoxin oxidoreductase subunit beta [Chloroflexi bacterium]|nr:2-oxoacid:ferredoxin oxidoreductase subunit beta [Chloroflexota bacterium]MBI4197561.1 2-oxoacid:ferredoxin oxidoreductase subunit beta [Chloroflexota bacterium]